MTPTGEFVGKWEFVNGKGFAVKVNLRVLKFLTPVKKSNWLVTGSSFLLTRESQTTLTSF